VSPSHTDASDTLHAAPQEAADTELRLGAQLRKAREQRGLSQAELGGRLNLAASIIDALEHEDLQALPGPVYVRGYLRRLAAELEIDEAALHQAHSRIAGPSAPTPLRPTLRTEPMRTPRRTGRFLLLLLVFAVVAIVVVGLLAQHYLPESWLKTNDAALPMPPPETPAPAMPQESIPLPPPPPVNAPSVSMNTQGGQEQAEVLSPHHDLTAAMPREASAPVEDPQPVAAPAAATMPQPESKPAVAATSTLELRTSKADSWVQVKDASGKVLLEEVLKPGSTRRVSGPRPLQVRVGNAAATSLVLDGQAVDLSPYTRPSGTAFIASLGG